MKKWKKFLASVITGVVLFSSSVCNVSAASANGVVQKQAYTYKVTIFAGNQGGFSGTNGLAISNKDAVVVQTEDKLIISGLNYGDEVSYTAQTDVKLDASSKYYVKGIRLGGRDNDTVAAAAFLVRGDMDYVVAYGIKGNQVSYTVNYHDENGKEMLPSEVFYGNVGDKPVIACKYIEGYEPQASGLTKTLKENAAENVLTFIYKPVKGPVVEDVIDTVVREEQVDVVVNQTVVVGGTESSGPTGTGGTGTGENVEPGTGEAGESGTTGESGEAGGTGEEIESSEGTTENNENADPSGDVIIEDLDDPEVPLAGEVDTPQDVVQDPTLMKYGLLAGSAAAILLLALAMAFILRKRTKNNEK